MKRSLILIIPFLFLVELILGGPGFWRITSVITARKALFVLTIIFLYAYAFTWKHWKLKSVDIILIVFLTANLTMWIGFLPALYNRNLNVAFKDGGSVLMLLLYFPLAHLVRTGGILWEPLKRAFVGLVFIVASTHVILWVIVYLFPHLDLTMRIAVINFFNTTQSLAANQLIYVGPMPDGFFRVMWISSLYMIPAIFIVLRIPSKKVIHQIFLVTFVIAIYFSYTRSFWLGLTTGILLLGFLRLLHFLRSGRVSFRSNTLPIVFILLVIIAILIFLKNPFLIIGLERIQSIFGTEEFMSIRFEQIGALIDGWAESPLMGNGFGAHAKVIRNWDAPYSYDLTDLLMKLGIAGLSFYFLTGFAIYFIACRVAIETKGSDWLANWLAIWIAFLIPCMTNPYFFTFVGMSIVLFLLLELAAREKTYDCQNCEVRRIRWLIYPP